MHGLKSVTSVSGFVVEGAVVGCSEVGISVWGASVG